MTNPELVCNTFEDFSLDFIDTLAHTQGTAAFKDPVCTLAESLWLAYLKELQKVENQFKPDLLAVTTSDFSEGYQATGIRKSIAYGETTILILSGEFAGYLAKPHRIDIENQYGPTAIIRRPLLAVTGKIDPVRRSVCQEYTTDGKLNVLDGVVDNLRRLQVPFDENTLIRNIDYFSALMPIPPFPPDGQSA